MDGLPTSRTTADRLRILVAAHGHPEISKGGAEVAAYRLFQQLQDRSNCEAWFMGCDRRIESDRTGAVIMQPFSDREYIYAPTEFDWFKFANRDGRFPEYFTALLKQLQPDVIHFHHYINYGVEVFHHVRQTLPNCRIVLTLHEYLAICHHFGQMVTTEHYNLCSQSSPVRCQRCFPEIGRSDFFLRKMYIQRFFNLVDEFVAPSQFLAKRYIDWGLPAEKMHVIENVVPVAEQAALEKIGAEKKKQTASGPLKVGFFGQISRLKGIDVLFDAAEILAEEKNTDILFDIFGDYRSQPHEFQKDFIEKLPRTRHNFRFHGPYDGDQVDALMRSVDVVVMASIWWENAPVVIQEAFRNRRPVICPNIGGMAEKVRDGIDGLHFPVGSPVALAALLKQLAGDRAILSRLLKTLTAPASAETVVDAHMRLYQTQGQISGRLRTLA